MKKLQVGPRNHRIAAQTTVRLVGTVAERTFRTDRLVITAKPADAKLLVIDVRVGEHGLVTDPPIAGTRFANTVQARRDGSMIRTVQVPRGTAVGVVISVIDPRDAQVSVWLEQLEREDLS